MRAEFSKRTKRQALQLQGRCRCGSTTNLEFHHEKACTYGGGADIENCIVLCRACHRRITKWQRAQIAKSNRIRAKHLGLKPASRRGFVGWRKMNGDPVWKKDRQNQT